MNETRRAKVEQECAAAEQSLRADLRRVLPRIAQHGNQLFLNSEWNRHKMPLRYLDSESEPILAAARNCERLHAALGLPLESSAANLFFAACREADSEHEHRRGPRRLAEWLLVELDRLEAHTRR